MQFVVFILESPHLNGAHVDCPCCFQMNSNVSYIWQLGNQLYLIVRGLFTIGNRWFGASFPSQPVLGESGATGFKCTKKRPFETFFAPSAVTCSMLATTKITWHSPNQIVMNLMAKSQQSLETYWSHGDSMDYSRTPEPLDFTMSELWPSPSLISAGKPLDYDSVTIGFLAWHFPGDFSTEYQDDLVDKYMWDDSRWAMIKISGIKHFINLHSGPL